MTKDEAAHPIHPSSVVRPPSSVRRRKMADCLDAEAGHFPGMNARLAAVVILTFAGGLALHAQVVPTTPTKFDTRRIGEGMKGGGTVGFVPVKPQTVVKTITHIVLGDPRQWMMSDGKFFVGKLIAFEDLVSVGNAATPAVPKNPTVVREGKARVLVNSKPFEIALDRLGADERKFIEDTRAALSAKK